MIGRMSRTTGVGVRAEQVEPLDFDLAKRTRLHVLTYGYSIQELVTHVEPSFTRKDWNKRRKKKKNASVPETFNA